MAINPCYREGCELCDGCGEVETTRAIDDEPITVGCPVCIQNDLEWLKEKAEEERNSALVREAELAAHVERLKGSLTDLVASSEGVYGLHLNGDPAPWSELLAGGRFEEWLVAFDETPTTSLARRDVDYRMKGALDIRHLTQGDDWEDGDLREVIDDYISGLRRQAEGETDG